MTPETKEFLFKFLNGEAGAADFEQWIYQKNGLQTSQPTLYQGLILFDFTDRNAEYEIKDHLDPYIDRTEFNVWRTKRLLNEIIEDRIDIVLGVRKLRELYFDTDKNFIPPALGIGYESELDDVPVPDEYYQWNENALKEKLKKVDGYRNSIKKSVAEFLATLKN